MTAPGRAPAKTTSVSRRTLAKGAAWTTPVLLTGMIAAPAVASPGQCQCIGAGSATETNVVSCGFIGAGRQRTFALTVTSSCPTRQWSLPAQTVTVAYSSQSIIIGGGETFTRSISATSPTSNAVTLTLTGDCDFEGLFPNSLSVSLTYRVLTSDGYVCCLTTLWSRSSGSASFSNAGTTINPASTCT